jgi:hypothetical protein
VKCKHCSYVAAQGATPNGEPPSEPEGVSRDYSAEAQRDHGAALALAKAALDHLDPDCTDEGELRHAAYLLHSASKHADHAATMRRMARRAHDDEKED